MDYISCESAAKKIGVSTRRIQQMCKQKEIVGAIKDGRNWLIPDNAILSPKKPLPIGVSDFKSATTNYYYVDKTLLIRDFLNAIPMVSLFTRPRRFGKTLNMDMLRVFFEKTPEDTSIYFKDKYIWQFGDYYTKHQGQYPVIFLSFKDVKCSSWQETFQKISKLISLEFMRHNELESSSVLSSYEKEQYHRFASENINEVDCQMGLQLLSLLLHKHYDKECVIIIDEYDTPIQQGHLCDFYNEIVDFMRNFFSGGLKDNPHLAFGFLTGILRVAKESILSGMNNLKTNSILDNNYSSYFGFTNEEVRDMLAYYDYEDKYINGTSTYDIPANIKAEDMEDIRRMAIEAFKGIDGKGLSRVDFFIDKDSGEIFINEINTLPGFTNISMYPKMWEATGLEYSKLIDRLIELALDSKK